MNPQTSSAAPSDTSRRPIRAAMVSSIVLLAVIGVVLVLTLTRGAGASHPAGSANHTGRGAGSSQSTPNCYPTRVVHWC
jgi:hypothetical protein